MQENVGTVPVTVTRNAGTTGTVGCTVITTSISAEGGAVDYDLGMQTLEFREGQNATEFTITIINDAIPELEEVSPYMLLGNNGTINYTMKMAGNSLIFHN